MYKFFKFVSILRKHLYWLMSSHQFSWKCFASLWYCLLPEYPFKYLKITLKRPRILFKYKYNKENRNILYYFVFISFKVPKVWFIILIMDMMQKITIRSARVCKLCSAGFASKPRKLGKPDLSEKKMVSQKYVTEESKSFISWFLF